VLKGHPSPSRYQCRECRKLACRGAAKIEDPGSLSTRDPPPHAAAEWLEWLERPCKITGHGAHLRHQCNESREQALRGCLVEAKPKD
jgi:hypothetical protein